MNYNETLIKESEVLETLIDKKFEEFTNKLNSLKLKDFDSEQTFADFCHELSQSYLYEFRHYVNSKFYSEENLIINGLDYTHSINILNFNLQVLISQKHKQFDILYHQYLSDNLSES